METESLSPHEKRLAAAERPTRRFSGRAFVSVATGLSFVAMSVTGGGRGAGRQGQQARSAAARQGGYGIGRLTLRQYCQQQNPDLEKAVQKLREKGFEPAPDATLRDIAVSGGVHPSASRLIIRTSSITQTARGERGLWTTTVAIAVLLLGRKGD
jgi:hypothetical protein